MRIFSIFVTNNGLADHIGVSQVLPYLKGLARKGHEITVVSLEDPLLWKKYGPPKLDANLQGALRYQPIFRRSGLIGRFQKYFMPINVWLRLRTAIRVRRPDLIHCRSYMPLEPCLAICTAHKIPLVFDTRGFWVDQRVEGGAWSATNPFSVARISYFRRLEARAYKLSDHIVALTDDAKEVIEHAPSYSGSLINVIPCAVSQSDFIISSTNRANARVDIGASDKTFVVCYLGSKSGVYRMDLVYKVYAAVRRLVDSAMLLLLGSHCVQAHQQAAASCGITLSANELVTREVPHSKVPIFLNGSDIGLSFQITTPSSLGVSATKVGEYVACGLPVGSNEGVGDIRKIIRDGETGAVLANDGSEEIARVAETLVEIARRGERQCIREHGFEYFSLSAAVTQYDNIYSEVGTNQK